MVQVIETYREANTATVDMLPILKGNTSDIVLRIRVHNSNPLLMQDIKAQLANLASDQCTRIAIQLSRQHPLVTVDQLHVAKVFQISHGLRSFQT